jgi:hypothetical protein
MPQVNRNAPCPCGSGKKYKNCCIHQDRVNASRELGMMSGEGYLMNQLFAYAQTPRFAGDVVEAFNFYWGGTYDFTGTPQLDPEDMRRAFEWFVHDYHTSTDRRHVIDLYLEREAGQLTAEGRAVLADWALSAMGCFRVLSIEEQETLHLYDCLRQSELHVRSRVYAHAAQRGDLLVGRLYTSQGAPHLSLMCLLLPNAYEAGLVDYAQNAYRLYQDEHPSATWDRFLKENGHLFNAYLLSAKAESLRSLIGPGTRYHDPAITRDKLREATRERLQERQRAEMEARRQGPPVRRTSSGLILPGAEERERPKSTEDEAPKPRILIPGRDA